MPDLLEQGLCRCTKVPDRHSALEDFQPTRVYRYQQLQFTHERRSFFRVYPTAGDYYEVCAFSVFVTHFQPLHRGNHE